MGPSGGVHAPQTSLLAESEPDEQWRRQLRLLFGGYFAVQAGVGSALWIGFFGSEKFRSWFELVGEVPEVTEGFGAGDLGLIVPASILSAIGIWRESRWAYTVVVLTLGFLLYPTVFLIYWVLQTGGDALTLGIMVPPCTMTGFIATWVYRSNSRSWISHS